MKKNVGKFDKTGRLIVAVIIAVLYFTNMITGTLALVLGIVALVMVFTAVVSFCPLYKILGLSTCQKCKSGDAE